MKLMKYKIWTQCRDEVWNQVWKFSPVSGKYDVWSGVSSEFWNKVTSRVLNRAYEIKI